VAKLLEAKAKLFGSEQAAAAIAVATEYDLEPAEAQKRLVRFLQTINPLAPVTSLAGRR
jgi:hypothetical protein